MPGADRVVNSNGIAINMLRNINCQQYGLSPSPHKHTGREGRQVCENGHSTQFPAQSEQSGLYKIIRLWLGIYLQFLHWYC
jgi:hypothetical protein